MADRDQNFVWNRGGIAQKGEEMLTTMSPQAVFESNELNSSVDYNEIEEVILRPLAVIFKLSNDPKPHGYNFMDKQYYQAIKDTLQPILGDRLKEKATKILFGLIQW